MKLDPIKQNSETATSKFFNLESDVVQLRSEIYHDNSRILTDVGLENLKNSLISTPLPALQTFKDNPPAQASNHYDCKRKSVKKGLELN